VVLDIRKVICKEVRWDDSAGNEIVRLNIAIVYIMLRKSWINEDHYNGHTHRKLLRSPIRGKFLLISDGRETIKRTGNSLRVLTLMLWETTTTTTGTFAGTKSGDLR